MKFSTGNHKASKLTGEQVYVMRLKYAERHIKHCTYGSLSREYGVSITTVSNILNGVTWQNVAGSGQEATVPKDEIAASLSRLASLAAGTQAPPIESELDNAAATDSQTRFERLMNDIQRHKDAEAKVDGQLDDLVNDKGDSNDTVGSDKRS